MATIENILGNQKVNEIKDKISKGRISEKDYKKLGSDIPINPDKRYEKMKTKPQKREKKEVLKEKFSKMNKTEKAQLEERQKRITKSKEQDKNLQEIQKNGGIKHKTIEEKNEENEKLINAILSYNKKSKEIQSTIEKKGETKEIKENIVFDFQIATNGPIKEFKNGEKFTTSELVSKKEEDKKIEQVEYKVIGSRIAKKNGAKLLRCDIIKDNKVVGKREFDEKTLKRYLNKNWMSLTDEKFIKELENWHKKTKNINKPKKFTLIKRNKTEKNNYLSPQEILDTMEEINDREELETEKGNEVQEIKNQISKLMEEMPKKDLKENKIFYNRFLEITKDDEIKEFIEQNLEKIKKIEELEKQLEIF